MREHIRTLAKKAVTGLVKPDDLIVDTGHGAIDWVFDRLPQKSRLETLTEDIARDIERLVEVEYGDRKVADAAVGNAIAHFENHAPTAGDLLAANLCKERVIEDLLDRGDRGLATADAAVRDLCRNEIVPRIVEKLLGDPALIEEIRPALYSTLLSRLDEIRSIQGDVGELLRRLAGRHLLIDPVQPLPIRWRDIHLLQAEYAVVPFHREARREELRDLIDWCMDEEPSAVRLMTGPGGTGKTRLAMELCQQIRSKGWRSGFLDRQMPDEPTWELEGLLRSDQPLLIIIDYAETRRGLVPLLEEVARHREGPRQRVVLLAREVAGWWPALQQSTHTLQAFLDDAFVPAQRLEPIAPEPNERLAILKGAMDGFQRRLDLPPPHLPALDLSRPLYADALYLHVEALATLRGERREETTEDALLNFVLKRERRAWQEGFHALDGRQAGADGLMQLLALVTLRGGLTSRAEGLALARKVPLLADLTEQSRRDVVELAERLYPERAGAAADCEAGATGARTAEALRPDLIGEQLVDEALADDAELLLPIALAPELPDVTVEHALTVLTRLAARKPAARRWLEMAIQLDPARLLEPALRVVIGTGEPMDDVLLETVDLHAMENRLPKQTVALAPFAVRVMERQRDRLHAHPKPWPDDVKGEIARVANNLAIRLSALGRRQDALDPAERAVDLCRELSEKAPAAHKRRLAVSLHNLANRLSDIGCRQQALEAAQEAVDVYRALAETAPGADRPNLATSLSNLANRLGDVGRRQEALAPAEEAVAIHRELAKEAPHAYGPYFAMALNNLANRHSDVGCRQQALEAAQEAVDVYRELAGNAPDAYKSDLAMALNNLAMYLSGVGRRQAALHPAQEAVVAFRELAAWAPSAYRPGLAKSLDTLANCLSDAGRRQEALAPAEEALAIRDELTRRTPDAYRPELAGSLHNIANRYSEVGRLQDALEPAEEAVRIRRELAKKAPDAYRPDLARSLNNLANRLGDLGRREGALELVEEAAVVYRDLVEKAPEAHASDLAACLDDLAIRRGEVGRLQEALLAAEESVEIKRKLAEVAPVAHEPYLALSLSTLGDLLEALNRLDDALSADTEAVTAIAGHFLAHPQAWALRVEPILRDYVRRREAAGREPDANLVGPIIETLNKLGSEKDDPMHHVERG